MPLGTISGQRWPPVHSHERSEHPPLSPWKGLRRFCEWHGGVPPSGQRWPVRDEAHLREASTKMDLLLWLYRVSQPAEVTSLTATGQLSN